MVKKKLQVFISSTYLDMMAERQAAVAAVLTAGHIPAGMELFTSGDVSQIETIKQWIDDSDAFMLILGGRYGSKEPESGKSYIELEYQYALERKIPCFAAVISDSYLEKKTKAKGGAVRELDNGALLKAFRATVTSKISRFFDNTDQVKIIAFESLLDIERRGAAGGWIKASEGVDSEATLKEMTRLTNENAELTNQIRELAAQIEDTTSRDPKVIAASLAEDARKMLVFAGNVDGRIMTLRHSGGLSILIGSQSFFESGDDIRGEARWRAARDQLVERRLIEPIGTQSEVFVVTHLGYTVYDEIKSSK